MKQSTTSERVSAFLIGYLSQGVLVSNTANLFQAVLNTNRKRDTRELTIYLNFGNVCKTETMDKILGLSLKVDHRQLIEHAVETGEQDALVGGVANRELMITAHAAGFIYSHIGGKAIKRIITPSIAESVNRWTGPIFKEYNSPNGDSIVEMLISTYWDLGFWDRCDYLERSILANT